MPRGQGAQRVSSCPPVLGTASALGLELRSFARHLFVSSRRFLRFCTLPQADHETSWASEPNWRKTGAGDGRRSRNMPRLLRDPTRRCSWGLQPPWRLCTLLCPTAPGSLSRKLPGNFLAEHSCDTHPICSFLYAVFAVCCLLCSLHLRPVWKYCGALSRARSKHGGNVLTSRPRRSYWATVAASCANVIWTG